MSYQRRSLYYRYPNIGRQCLTSDVAFNTAIITEVGMSYQRRSLYYRYPNRGGQCLTNDVAFTTAILTEVGNVLPAT